MPSNDDRLGDDSTTQEPHELRPPTPSSGDPASGDTDDPVEDALDAALMSMVRMHPGAEIQYQESIQIVRSMAPECIPRIQARLNRTLDDPSRVSEWALIQLTADLELAEAVPILRERAEQQPVTNSDRQHHTHASQARQVRCMVTAIRGLVTLSKHDAIRQDTLRILKRVASSNNTPLSARSQAIRGLRHLVDEDVITYNEASLGTMDSVLVNVKIRTPSEVRQPRRPPTNPSDPADLPPRRGGPPEA